ncbi:MAG TPA: PAS domain-containing sensor histidine kinase, partial [Chromatiaceae bacterium]|nr:PAS domain-containing sensor histidine kinase [Chromatiaceae bacterium]
QTFRNGEARFIQEDLFWRKNGSSFPVEYSSTPLRDEKGRIVGSVVVFRDIGERKKAEKAARQYQMELAHVARLSTMGEMASGMAHELNQPLTAIATNADASIRLLEADPAAGERVIDILETIGAQARRAGEIIQQLRQFVRKEDPRRSRVDLNQLIDEVLMLAQPEIEAAGISLVRDLDPDLPEVAAQRIQIDQVILNLVRNAIDAMREVEAGQRRLTLRTQRAGGRAVIVTVQDSGPGLAPEIADKLFDPFVTSKPHGMGLGLSISQGIISAHGGKLYHEENHEGTLFRFILPVSENLHD